MRKLLVAMALAVFTTSCTSPDEDWKTKKFALSDCKGSKVIWDPGKAPSQWKAYIVVEKEKTPVELVYRGGFEYRCGLTPEGVLEIHYLM